MGTITLSVPDELKEKMSKTDWINWSSVARHAFSDTLKDMEELQLKKKMREISEIADDDNREVKESVFKEFVESVEKTSKELKSGKRKAMSIEEFNELCEKL
ncbi:hypothetical protein HYV80_01435 [Candidatus Woesearchaeota archaeon]|nr:hypothetical protein [Candidatus Woesearchaeota archaeon]